MKLFRLFPEDKFPKVAFEIKNEKKKVKALDSY